MATRDLYNFSISTNTADYNGEWLFGNNNVNNPSYNQVTIAAGPQGNLLTISGGDPKAIRLLHYPAPGVITGRAFYGVSVACDQGPNQNTNGYVFGVGGIDGQGRMQYIFMITATGAIQLFDQTSSALVAPESGFCGLGCGVYGRISKVWESVASLVPVDGSTNYLEWSVTLAGAASVIEFRVNNQVVATTPAVTLASGSGLRTQGGIYFCGSVKFSNGYATDTIGTVNNTYIGDVLVIDLVATGPGSKTDFVAHGAASNWQVATTTPPVPATIYNESGTVGASDLFTHAALPDGTTAVLAVAVRMDMQKSSAGPRTMTATLLSNATTAQGAVLFPSTTPQSFGNIYDVDPATNQPWTVAAVNAVQYGYTIAS